MNRILVVTLISCVMIAFSSCSDDPDVAGVEYMPDMYRTPAIEPYSANAEEVMIDSSNAEIVYTMTSRKSVDGTIAYSKDAEKAIFNTPYPYTNTTEGYEKAGEELKNPIILTDANRDEVLANGKEVFTNYCVYCHGDKGDGLGNLVTSEKMAKPPNYWDIQGLTVGKMYHTLQYGKGQMGSHASQLSQEQRWTVIHYVSSLIEVQTSAGEEEVEEGDAVKVESDTTATIESAE